MYAEHAAGHKHVSHLVLASVTQVHIEFHWLSSCFSPYLHTAQTCAPMHKIKTTLSFCFIVMMQFVIIRPIEFIFYARYNMNYCFIDYSSKAPLCRQLGFHE